MKKKTPIKYKRNKVEITGDPSDVKTLILIDSILAYMWIFIVIVLLFVSPKASFLSALFQWLKKYIPLLILFVALADYWLLSG